MIKIGEWIYKHSDLILRILWVVICLDASVLIGLYLYKFTH